MNTCNAAKPRLTILMAALGMLSALPAHALVIDGLSGQATAQAGINMTVNQGPITSPTSVFVSVSDSDGASSAGAEVFGYVQGPYRASARGSNGVFDSTGHFIRTWDITNDSGVAQNYSFTFLINGGGLYANYDGTGYADYTVDIRRDGVTSLFSSTAKITNNGTLTTTGTALNGASQAGSSYGWADTYVTVNLGVLGVGQFTSVAYDLISHVFGNYGPVDCLGRFSNLDLDPGCVESYAHFGDPNQLNATPIPGIGIVAANAVPEPGTLGLLGLGGLAVLGLRRRRHP